MNSLHDAAAITQPEPAPAVKLSKWQRMTEAQRENHKATMAKWRERNAERHAANLKKYRKENRETFNRAGRKWRKKNPEKQKMAHARWNAANPDKVKAQAQRTLARDKGPTLEYGRAWRRKHPEKVREKNQRKYYKDIAKSRADGVVYANNRRTRGKTKLSKTILAQRVREQNHKCLYCPADFREVMATHEHLIPLARGGTNADENIAASCGPCNSRKFTRTHDEFLALLASEGVA